MIVFGILFSSIFKINQKSLHYSSSDIFIGILTLISLCSINAWLLDVRNNLFLILELIIFSSIFIYCFRNSTVKVIRFTRGAKTTFASTIILSVFSTIAGVKNHIYYVNPDPYGYMSLSGALKKYGNFPAILEEWEKYTGNNFQFDSNWNIPTRLLERSWLVPDLQVRYAADSLNFPRVGISSFTASIPDLLYSANIVNVLFLAFTLFACSALIGSLVEIANINSNLNTDIKNLKSLIASFQSPILLGSMFLTGPWVLVLIYEGFAAHLITMASTVIVINLIISESIIINAKLNTKLLYKLTLILLSTYFIYLQQLPIIMLAIFVLIFFEFLKNKTNQLITYTMVFLILAGLSILSLLLPGTKYLLGQIQGNNGHGSVHIGSPGILEILGLNNNFFRDQIGNTKPVASQIFLDTLNSNAAIGTTQIGYTQFSTSMISILLQGFLVIFLITVSLIILKLLKELKNGMFPISIIIILTILYSCYYIYTHVYQVFITYKQGKLADIIFNDYIWLRLLSIIVVFLYIYIALLYNSLEKKFNLFKSSGMLFFVSLLFFISSFNFISTAKQYSKYAAPGIIEDCKYFNTINNPVFIWNDSQANQTAISIAVCGFPVFALTDSFPGVKLPNGNSPYNVVYLNYDSGDKSWRAKIIGTLDSNNSLVTPCNMNCLEESLSFQKFKAPIDLF